MKVILSIWNIWEACWKGGPFPDSPLLRLANWGVGVLGIARCPVASVALTHSFQAYLPPTSPVGHFGQVCHSTNIPLSAWKLLYVKAFLIYQVEFLPYSPRKALYPWQSCSTFAVAVNMHISFPPWDLWKQASMWTGHLCVPKAWMQETAQPMLVKWMWDFEVRFLKT